MSIAQQIMDLLGPFLPVLAKIGDGASEEVGRQLPERISRAVPLLSRKHRLGTFGASQLRRELEEDPEFRDQLASALGIHFNQTNSTVHNQLHSDTRTIHGDWVEGDKVSGDKITVHKYDRPK